MKKFNLIILSFVLIFSFSIVTKAECNNEELNEWATTISAKVVFNTEKTVDKYQYAYFLTVTPSRDDIKIVVSDAQGNSKAGEKYDLLNIYGVGCYTNINEETYEIKVYGGEKSACKNELLRTISYTIEPYNDMIKTEECEK